MRRLRSILLLLFVFIMLAGATNVQAQTYSFQVPTEAVGVFVNSDGTLTLDYTITFQNNPSADPIDIVDIGMPNPDYILSSIKADVGGSPVSDIRPSTVVSPGIEVHLGKYTIQPGQTGTLHVNVGTVNNAIGASTLQETQGPYASIVFTPSSFDQKFVSGKTHMTFSIILPPGMNAQEPRYHTPSSNWPGTPEPAASFDSQSRVVYTWDSADANAYTVYTFGASFPERLVPSTSVVATETPKTPLINWSSVGPCLCFSGILVFIVGIGVLGAVSANKRKLQYMPPKISIEGHGIKRGLTAVEAAVLMEQPLDKVMTMILFSALKKGAATVTSRDPLKLDVADPLPADLQPYETTFLGAFKTENPREQRTELQNVIVGLVKSVSEKMKGFNRKLTVEYYDSIIEQAWTQVSAVNTPDVKSQTYEEVMDWTMADQNWETRTTQTFGPQPIFLPTWWWRYDPVMRGAGVGGAGHMAAPAPMTGGGAFSMPKLPGSDFAASVVKGVQSFSSGVIGDVKSFTSGVTNRTNPVPVQTSTGSHPRSGGFGGGGGCACACACAGCACACAGGGR